MITPDDVANRLREKIIALPESERIKYLESLGFSLDYDRTPNKSNLNKPKKVSNVATVKKCRKRSATKTAQIKRNSYRYKSSSGYAGR